MRHPVSVQSCCSWSSNPCSSMWAGPQVYIAYELVLTSPSVFCMSCSSNLDGFQDGRKVSIQRVLCRMLPLGLVRYISHHSCAIAVKLSLYTLSQLSCGESIQQYWHDRCLEKLRFILFDRSDFHKTNSLSIAVQAFTSFVLISFSVDEMLLPR